LLQDERLGLRRAGLSPDQVWAISIVGFEAAAAVYDVAIQAFMGLRLPDLRKG